ncbi:S-locus glycoprotein family protein [Medicago truncatula]|uniref:S-locus glycoprotein family protein n=1 Tax=Medicago truncatula TaxID=3880 RepID=G7KQ09_MEDTR|nr:S-locus glycoprotein family protein [Medicago truncatula]
MFRKRRLTKKIQSGFFSLPVGNGGQPFIVKKLNKIGIWYHELEPQTFVWVANRDSHLLDSSGILVLRDDNGRLSDSFKLPTYTLEYRKIYRIRNHTEIYWESGEILPKPLIYLLNNGKNSSHAKYVYYLSLDDYRNIRMLMNSVKIWWKPYDVCDFNDYCRNLTTCNRHKWKQCRCLPGFSPRLSIDDGEQFGCLRKSQCSTTNNDTSIHLTNIIVKNLDTRIFTKSEVQIFLHQSDFPHSLTPWMQSLFVF